ncbi:peptidoglycan/xylan/chitin deacetylase (PgdA/CDA1 family) [Psychromicrobium silvestre]|uniref:Peptidoglycan/xylan/chitin deacetylase (PgdA/CDA1 family) n=1 Tax=Psychromicrobium silvestre TaxID=1645614 RepID=A0A7Y9S8P5_9MICC|nr:polysaccharide deacetylase family protein [Psychromicrobium silvestre]NYE96186.1 peptidoglycan/xylan/chitin deacetylase (PgdA/CDA1 family) [Psychromicrobium silvestre]
MPHQLPRKTKPFRWALLLICVLLVTASGTDGIRHETPLANRSKVSVPNPQTFNPWPSEALEAPRPLTAVPESSGNHAGFELLPIRNGLVPVLTKIPTRQKVVFLTIDDGAYKTAEEVLLLKRENLKATLFLAYLFIANNPDFFKAMQANGSEIENHTVSHPLNLISLPFKEQKKEICGMSDYERQKYGRSPVFFRPPGGPYTQALRKAAAECGIKAIIDWNVEVIGGSVKYQEGKTLRPGDIVLMHFRREFSRDLRAFLAAQKAAGLKVVLLEDFLKVH